MKRERDRDRDRDREQTHNSIQLRGSRHNIPEYKSILERSFTSKLTEMM